MPYTVIVTNPARKQINKLSVVVQERIITAIDTLAQVPHPPNAEPIKGLADTFRIRVGDYRIIYSLHDDELLILVIRVGHRREVYRRL